jgi:hypothetical protein
VYQDESDDDNKLDSAMQDFSDEEGESSADEEIEEIDIVKQKRQK